MCILFYEQQLKTPFCFRHAAISDSVLTANPAGFETKHSVINDLILSQMTLIFLHQKMSLTPTKIPLKEC